jgi:GMP synthase (glutamine-hydrolysing)
VSDVPAGPRTLVVEHQASCPSALVGTWLEEVGAVLDVCRPWAGDALPDLASYDALLVLGGEMGANDDATVPWLTPLKELVREAAATRLPTLGICLGHQVIAVALGGEVRRNPLGQAVGVLPVGWTPDRADDPLTGGLTGARGIQWNNDVVTRAPAGTVVLAESAAGELQVARFAPGVWGVQLHPEADGLIVRAWAESDRADHLERGLDQDAVLAEVDAARAELDAAWRPLAHRFAELAVAGRRARS